MRHFIAFLIGFFTLAYLLIGLVLYFEQKNFIYFPSSTENVGQWQKEKFQDHTLYLYLPKNHNKVIVVFHGNAGSAINRVAYNDLFPNEDVVINEYPGYGVNANEDVNYQQIIFYANKTMQNIIQKYGHDNVILLGESLGSGVASEMAEKYHIQKLILITPYSSFLDLAKRQFFMYPIKWMLQEDFDNIRALKHYQGQVTMVVASNDQVINPKYALKLYNTLKMPKYLFMINGAGHNDWMRFITKEDLESIEQLNNNTQK
jgi:uncharacterized protein